MSAKDSVSVKNILTSDKFHKLSGVGNVVELNYDEIGDNEESISLLGCNKMKVIYKPASYNLDTSMLQKYSKSAQE